MTKRIVASVLLLSLTGFSQTTGLNAPGLSGTPALPSGTTATTQAASDNSTKLATTAFTGMVQISKQVLGSPAATVTFSSIPTGYSSLYIVYTVRLASAQSDLIINFNGDTAAHYDYAEFFAGATSNANASGPIFGFSTASPNIGTTAGSSAPANAAAAGTITIPDYTNTTFNKRATGLAGRLDASTSNYVISFTVGWQSTAAITSLTLGPASAVNMVAGSTFTLYGMR